MKPVDKKLGLTVERLREVLAFAAARELHGDFANDGGP